jgi:hypothetical protein
VFLGFSYHPENMKLLTVDAPGNTNQVFGTAKDISVSDVALILEQVRKLVGGKALNANGHGPEQIFIKDLTCTGLLQEYSRSLFTPSRAD